MGSISGISTRYKGTYSDVRMYSLFDEVEYSGYRYVAIKTACGISPQYEEYWRKLADIEDGSVTPSEMASAISDAVDPLTEQITSMNAVKADNVPIGYSEQSITVVEGSRPNISGKTVFEDDSWLTGDAYRHTKVSVSEHIGETVRIKGTTGGSVSAYPVAFAVDADGTILQRWGDATASVIYGYETPVSGQTNTDALEIIIPESAAYLYVSGQEWTLLDALPTVEFYVTKPLKTYIDEQIESYGAWDIVTHTYDNLLELDDGEYSQDGLTIRVSEKTRVSISGQNTAGATVTIPIGSIDLAAGTYYAKGYKTLGGDTYAYDVDLVISAGNTEIAMHYYRSFTVSADGTYTVSVRVKIFDELNLSSFFYIRTSGAFADDSEYFPPYIQYYRAKHDYANVNENRLYGKFVSVEGDSVCKGGTRYNGAYVKMIAERNNMTWENNAVSGAVITEDGNTSLHHITSGVLLMDADADYAICEGGYNDYIQNEPIGVITAAADSTVDTATFYGALEQLARNLITRFAGKKVAFIFMHRVNDAGEVTNTEGLTLSDYHDAVVAVMKKYGIKLFDLYNECPLVSAIDEAYAYTSEGIHPMYAGYELYYVPIIEAGMRML